MKFIIDLSLDGYNSVEEEEKACIEFIKENLDFSGSTVKISLAKFVRIYGSEFYKEEKINA